jgi:hypothetical protein
MRKHLGVGCGVRALVGTAAVVRTGVVVGFAVDGVADVVTVFATALVAFVAAVVWTVVTVIDGSCVA